MQITSRLPRGLMRTCQNDTAFFGNDVYHGTLVANLKTLEASQELIDDLASVFSESGNGFLELSAALVEINGDPRRSQSRDMLVADATLVERLEDEDSGA